MSRLCTHIYQVSLLLYEAVRAEKIFFNYSGDKFLEANFLHQNWGEILVKQILFGQNSGSKIWGEEQKFETNSFGSQFFGGRDCAQHVLGKNLFWEPILQEGTISAHQLKMF